MIFIIYLFIAILTLKLTWNIFVPVFLWRKEKEVAGDAGRSGISIMPAVECISLLGLIFLSAIYEDKYWPVSWVSISVVGLILISGSYFLMFLTGAITGFLTRHQ